MVVLVCLASVMENRMSSITQPTTKYKSEFDQGFEAFENKIPIWDNPYPNMPRSYDDCSDRLLVADTKREFWIRGWCEALYRSEYFQ